MGQLATAASSPTERQFLGHPRGLSTLFFAEMWERFSFYSLKTLMTLFMPLAIIEGGLGFGRERTGMVIAIYSSLVYLANFPGGWVADKILGLRRGVLCGGIVIMLGHICLAFHGVPFFFSGLSLVVIGTGLLKPNMSAMVGQLYAPGDSRRDAGFSLYYMGINVGAFLAPFIAGYLAQGVWFKRLLGAAGIDPRWSWHFGFAAAAVGMFFGLVQYVRGGRYLGDVGRRLETVSPEERRRTRKTLLVVLAAAVALTGLVAGCHLCGLVEVTLPRLNFLLGAVLVAVPVGYFGYNLIAGPFSPEERRRLGVVAILFVFSMIYFTGLEQGGAALNLFGDEHSRHEFFGVEFPSLWFQFLNPLYIIVLSGAFAWLWLRLGRHEPSTSAKFAIGLVIVGATFVGMAYAAHLSQSGRVSPFWLVGVFLGIAVAELCISPVGLSMVTKIAPARVTGQVMGIWFVGNALANFLAGQTVVLTTRFSECQLFGFIAGVSLAGGVVLIFLRGPIHRLMGGAPAALV